MAPLVSIENLTVAFDGVAVLHGIDLQVERGEALGLVGVRMAPDQPGGHGRVRRLGGQREQGDASHGYEQSTTHALLNSGAPGVLRVVAGVSRVSIRSPDE